MRPTPRFWGTAGAGCFLCLLAVILGEVVLLGAATLVACTLVVSQYRFTNSILTAADVISVEQELSRSHVPTDEPILLTLQAELPVNLPLDVRVEPSLPIVATDVTPGETAITLDGTDPTQQSIHLSVPTAGVVRFRRPRVTVSGSDGFFEETFRVGSEKVVTVEPRAPRHLHVGQGGNRISVGFGEHTSEQRGSGLEPAEIRQYVYGDDISRIDWKATARFNHPHIRDYELPTARQTALIVDHRESLSEGKPGETKLDYLREVALAFVNSADSLEDPVGLYTVGDEGGTNMLPPGASETHYQSIRSILHNLEPTTAVTAVSSLGSGDAALSRRTVTHLLEDDTQFGATLEPYFRSTNRYIERFDERPLFSTTRYRLGRLQGSVWNIVLTDDAHPSELYESIKLMRRSEGRILVFIAPSVLFTSALGDIETAYDEYHEFESFRKRLNELDGVTAFEVAHETRLASIRQSRSNRQR